MTILSTSVSVINLESVRFPGSWILLSSPVETRDLPGSNYRSKVSVDDLNTSKWRVAKIQSSKVGEAEEETAYQSRERFGLSSRLPFEFKHSLHPSRPCSLLVIMKRLCTRAAENHSILALSASVTGWHKHSQKVHFILHILNSQQCWQAFTTPIYISISLLPCKLLPFLTSNPRCEESASARVAPPIRNVSECCFCLHESRLSRLKHLHLLRSTDSSENRFCALFCTKADFFFSSQIMLQLH